MVERPGRLPNCGQGVSGGSRIRSSAMMADYTFTVVSIGAIGR